MHFPRPRRASPEVPDRSSGPFLPPALYAAAAYALLGEAGFALLAAAAWGASRLFSGRPRNPREGASEGPPTSGGGFSRRGFLLPGILVSCTAMLLLSESLRSGALSRASLLDAFQAALACSAFLVSLGLPLAESLVPGAPGSRAFREVRGFQASFCLGAGLAFFGAVLFGWIPPLSTAQTVWANLAGAVLPSLALARAPGPPSGLIRGDTKPQPGARSGEGFPPGRRGEVLAEGMILGIVLLAVYRWALGPWGRTPGSARSLVFLTLCLAQAVRPLRGLRAAAASGPSAPSRRSMPAWVVRAGAGLAALVLTGALFALPPVRSSLGLLVLTPADVALAAAAAAAERGAVGAVRTAFAQVRKAPRGA